MKLIVVCEALADFQVASCLIRRSLLSHGPQWLEDLPEVTEFRGWAESARTDHAVWIEIDGEYDRKGGRPLFGRRRGPYSIPPTKAILLAQREHDLGGLVLMVDLDREGKERRNTFLRVRDEAGLQPFEILVATPDPEREAWVLHGFEPEPHEAQKLLEQRRILGFDPRLEPERLRGDVRKAETPRDIKRILGLLTGDDRDRERRCFEETSLEQLAARGKKTFLMDFLEEIRKKLLPRLVGGRS